MPRRVFFWRGGLGGKGETVGGEGAEGCVGAGVGAPYARGARGNKVFSWTVGQLVQLDSWNTHTPTVSNCKKYK